MKICFLGDSITQGAAASAPEKNYVSLVGELLGCEALNFGVGGTRIARQTSPFVYPEFDEDYIIRAEKMPKDADLVFVFGGTNDYGHGDAELGKMGDRTHYTFFGALTLLVEYLIDKYGKEKLTFILPLPRYNQSSVYGDGWKKTPSPTLAEYIAVERAVLDSFGIPYLDLSADFPEPDTSEPTDIFSDGLHPTDKGHRILAERVAEYVKAK